ncbi:unnamed protein product [Ambrosiozyma monospora]|uniref:Unnamed protein product n=1 Tax=Ambrosiozyma monospora TaxID=43982 RepID=A0ACB5SUP5_AMBMO|nr:unnamed protein product [Ambrosiozyma monospora]
MALRKSGRKTTKAAKSAISNKTKKEDSTLTKSKAKLAAKQTQGNDSNKNNDEPPKPTKPPKYEKDPIHNRRYWLIKSEPCTRIDPKTGQDAKFSLRDLSEVKQEPWNGVRNYEAKNNLLTMAKGDICLFYHSNCSRPGIVGLARVVTEQAKPDELQFDSKSPYFDSKAASSGLARWWCPDVEFLCILKRKITLNELKNDLATQFGTLCLLNRGRLSVAPVNTEDFNNLMKLQMSGPNEAGESGEDEFDCDVNGLAVFDEKFLQ